MSVISVKVKYIRPAYHDLREWMNDDNNVYIGRKGIVFIDGVRFPKEDSIWCNPFKITATTTREMVLAQYEQHINNKLQNPEMVKALLLLQGKTLGCWCREPQHADELICHGDILLRKINEHV